MKERDCGANDVAKKWTEQQRDGARRQPFLTDATLIDVLVAGADRQLMERAVAVAGKSLSD